jgi:hypothetical protein
MKKFWRKTAILIWLESAVFLVLQFAFPVDVSQRAAGVALLALCAASVCVYSSYSRTHRFPGRRQSMREREYEEVEVVAMPDDSQF